MSIPTTEHGRNHAMFRRPLRRAPSVSLMLCAASLAIAVAVALIPFFVSDRSVTITRPLAAIVPAAAVGWDVRNLDIAGSEEMRSRVMNVLRYDDIFYRSYRRGGVEVQVYAAYWKPGTVPYGQAGVHTPDTCWVTNGWMQEERRHAELLKVGPYTTKPAETGRFSLRGEKLEVMFWHLVGGRVHGYEQYGWSDGIAGVRERLPHLFEDLRRYGLNLAQEQIFVRISSSVSLKTLLQDPGFWPLLETLRPLGIFEE